MSEPKPLPEDAAGFLRYLAAELCTALIDMSTPGASALEIDSALDRAHELAGELWILTKDMRAPTN